MREAACRAHARRKFYDLHAATKSPLAEEALRRIGKLYEIEAEIRGQPPDERRRVRQAQADPLLEALQQWLQATLATVSAKSEQAGAIGYALKRWTALTRYRDDGTIEIDNDAAERALRGPVLSRKNFLFAGADCGGQPRGGAVHAAGDGQAQCARSGGVPALRAGAHRRAAGKATWRTSTADIPKYPDAPASA